MTLRHVTMAQGTSGRIVIDVDPEFKQELYEALRESGSTLKDWFLRHASEFCDEHKQPSLQMVAEPRASYGANQKKTVSTSIPQSDANERS